MPHPHQTGRRLAWLAGVMLAAAAPAWCAPASPAAPRQQIVLSEGWRFHFEGAHKDLHGADIDDANWEKVTTPHSWNRVGYYLASEGRANRPDTVNLNQGEGWYRLHFRGPSLSAGQRAYLQFDAASRLAEVWLNGVRLGEHKGGFSRFRLPASGVLRPNADNLLVVRVNNAKPEPGAETEDVLPLAGDFFVHGGLYRPVSLLVVGRAHFDLMDHGGPGVYLAGSAIEAKAAVATVTARIANDDHADYRGEAILRLRDAQGAVVASARLPLRLARGEVRPIATRLKIDAPHLWQGVEDPYLYRLEAELRDAHGRVQDQVVSAIGLRDIRFDAEKGLLLNGRPLRLHGVSHHQDKEGEGWALSAADEDQDFALIREMGANTVRLSHYQQSEHIHDLADRLGLILWDEIPLVSKWTQGRALEPSAGLISNAQSQLEELIRQNQNHPSVAVWSIANEVDFGAAMSSNFGLQAGATPDPRPLLRRLNALAKTLDPSRPTTLATCCEERSEIPGAAPPVVAEITDVFGANRYYGWYYGPAEAEMPYIDRNHQQHAAHPMSVSEYGAGGALTQYTDNPLGGLADPQGRAQPEDYESHVHEVIWAAMEQRPYLWAAYVWNMFDFATTIRAEGDSQDINTKGLVTYDRKTRKDAFYFYKANWSSSPVVHIANARYVERAYPAASIKVYSNGAATELWLNGRSLGVRSACPTHVCLWSDVRLAEGDNRLEARSGQQADAATLHLSAERLDHYRVDAGGLMVRDTPQGLFGSDTFFTGGRAADFNARTFQTKGMPLTPVEGAIDGRILSSYRAGTFSYDLPASPGTWLVTLSLLEPEAKAVGERVFDVLTEGQPVLNGLDPIALAGKPYREVRRNFTVNIRGDRLHLDFKPRKGEAVVSAIEVERIPVPLQK